MSMEMTGMTIAVLMGGPGSERDVSLASGRGVAGALASTGAKVVEFALDSADLPALPPGIDIAFNLIHGTFGEDGQLQALLEKQGIPYTGERVAGSRLAFDKILTKQRFLERGVATARFEVIQPGQAPSLPLPYVVKAPREGSSVGVYIVKQPGEVAAALAGAFALSDDVLVEEFVAGRELTVGILGDRALPVIEIRPKDGFYDFKNKYPFLNPAGAAEHFCPAPLTLESTGRVQRVALEAKDALDLEVYSRVDLLLPQNGEPSVLEINTIPGMTSASLLPEAAAAAGISYPGLCRRIIELSLKRMEARVS